MPFHHGPAEKLRAEVSDPEAEVEGGGLREVGGPLPLVPGDDHTPSGAGGGPKVEGVECLVGQIQLLEERVVAVGEV